MALSAHHVGDHTRVLGCLRSPKFRCLPACVRAWASETSSATDKRMKGRRNNPQWAARQEQRFRNSTVARGRSNGSKRNLKWGRLGKGEDRGAAANQRASSVAPHVVISLRRTSCFNLTVVLGGGASDSTHYSSA